MIEKQQRLTYILIVAIAIIAIIALIIVKINVPTFKLGNLLIISGIVILVLAGIGFGIHFLSIKNSSLPEKKELPTAITTEEAVIFCENLIKHKPYYDYIEIDGGTQTEQAGKGQKSSIFTCKGNGKYTGRKYVIILNMHTPTKINTVLINPKESEIYAAKIHTALQPEEEPMIRRIFSKNPILGTETISEEVTKPEDKKEDKKEADI
jgi:hypothetical protein